MAWLQASRPLAAANILLPLAFGQALAFHAHHRFSWAMAGVALLFGVLDQCMIVFANDWADAESDALNEQPTAYSGGSRVIQEGKLAPKQLARAAGLCMFALIGLGLWLAVNEGIWDVLGLVISAIVLLWAYSFGPLALSYRGYGELLQGIGVGAVLPLVGFALQAGSLESAPYAALIPSVMLGIMGNILTALPDEAADFRSGKRSYPVRLGADKARLHSVLLLAIASVGSIVVLKGFSATWIGAVMVVPAGALVLNLMNYEHADIFRDRSACMRFVTVGAVGGNALLLGWTLVLAFCS